MAVALVSHDDRTIARATFEERVRAVVDWSALEGAYGRSDSSTREDDVAATLIASREGKRVVAR